MKIGIIGAGALGLTAAYQLTKEGHTVTVFEKENAVGGLAVDFTSGTWHLEKFYHHLFQTDTQISGLIKELGLGKKLIWKKPDTSVYFEGKIYPIDTPLAILRFSPISFFDRVRLGIVMLYLKIQPNYTLFERTTAVYWLRTYLGKRCYAVLWEPLLKAKFGQYFDKIAMSWFWARIHYRTPALGYLKNGFYQFYETLAEKFVSKGGTIQFKSDITNIASRDDHALLTVNGKEEVFDRLIVTVPTPVFFKLTPDLSEEYKEKYAAPTYYAAQTVVLQTDRKILDVYWLNVNDPSMPFMAYVEHTNFMPSSDYENNHLIYLGNYFAQTDPRFTQPEKETVAEYLQALKTLRPDFDPSWVKKSWVFRTPFAQPIVGIDYRSHIPPFDTPLTHVYLANMAQVYPQDRGQNYSVALGKRIADLVG